MTYVVTEACIKCKYTDCVEVCPDECIDCGVCEPECPADAIKADTETGLEKWLMLNAKFAAVWPNISDKKEPPVDAEEYQGAEGKFDKFFSESPGPGN